MDCDYDVLFFTNGAGQLGGAERSIGELAVELRARGARVLMLADRVLEDTPYASILAAGDVPTRWVDFHPEKSLWRNVREAWRVHRTYRAPILQFNVSWRSRLWVVPLTARLASPRAKVIGRVCSMPDPARLVPRRRVFWMFPGMQLWTLKPKFISLIWGLVASRLVSVNRDEFPRRMISEYWFRARRIRVIRNGVPPRSEALTSTVRDALRDRTRTGPGDLLIVYAGRLDFGKGIDHLLQAISPLPKSYRVAIVGEGVLEQSLRTQAAGLGISNRVTFTGFQPNPRDWIAACDIAVAPSVGGEGLSRAVLEALAEGTPVIASRVSGVREIFENNIHGLFFEPGDVAGLRRAILTMGENKDLRRSLAKAGYQLFHSEYHTSRVGETYAAMYAEVLGRGHPSAFCRARGSREAADLRPP